jgi:hypothetical protein
MKINRRFVLFATRVFNSQHWLAAIKRKAVRIEVLAIGLLLMPVILVMADHLPFVDVPSGSFYHGAVGALYNARITTGTTPTTFSPEDLVTRGQMAVFLHRGLGRIAYDETDSIIGIGTDTVDLAVISLFITGGVPGGTGFVKLDGVVNSRTKYSYTTGCPCSLQFYITRDGGGGCNGNYTNLNDGVGIVHGHVNGALTCAVSVPTGTYQTFRLKARFSGSEGPLPENYTSGSLTAIYAPFGKFGGNTLSSSEEVGEESIPNRQ